MEKDGTALNVNVTDYAFKWNELLKAQLISRVRLLTAQELSGGDSEVGERAEEFRSVKKHDHLPVAQTVAIHRSTFCGFCVIYSELRNTGYQEVCCRKTQSSGGEQTGRLEATREFEKTRSVPESPCPFSAQKDEAFKKKDAFCCSYVFKAIGFKMMQKKQLKQVKTFKDGHGGGRGSQ